MGGRECGWVENLNKEAWGCISHGAVMYEFLFCVAADAQSNIFEKRSFLSATLEMDHLVLDQYRNVLYGYGVLQKAIFSTPAHSNDTGASSANDWSRPSGSMNVSWKRVRESRESER